jgi:hypothetical protein
MSSTDCIVVVRSQDKPGREEEGEASPSESPATLPHPDSIPHHKQLPHDSIITYMRHDTQSENTSAQQARSKNFTVEQHDDDEGIPGARTLLHDDHESN